MIISDKSMEIRLPTKHKNVLMAFSDATSNLFERNSIPIRFAVTKSSDETFFCEIGSLDTHDESFPLPQSIFQFRAREYENHSQFNAVMLIPTGIDCEIGGHAGDATPVVRLLSSFCNHLIIHPNVVNASDINELTDNCLVVEGSVLSRLLMGTVGLEKVPANRVLVVLEDVDVPEITQATINSVSAARVTLGLNVTEVICMRQPCSAKIQFSTSGRASGTIQQLENLVNILIERQDTYDAVALVTVLGGEKTQDQLMYDYYVQNTINPWGGIEAMLTHALSMLINKPTMHAPMMESAEPLNFGIVDPRKSAEVVSRTYMHCIMKGLHRSPKIVTNTTLFGRSGILSVEDIHCLVIPEGVLGLPTLAAMQQGIPVIAVRENKNLMQNWLEDLPFTQGKYFVVDNYLEAAGLMAALKAGVCPSALRRPIPQTLVHEMSLS
ncbi:MAG: DUF3326 domain-containing protein [bacterium]|nr:DUF3326 domain-containing protein [bacterium]